MNAVQALQALCGVLWLAEAAILAPGALRVWRHRGDALDARRVPILLFSLVQVGFSARWFIWSHTIEMMGPTELAFWATCYAASAASAVFFLASHRVVNRAER